MGTSNRAELPTTQDFIKMIRAARFALVCLPLTLSYFSIRGSLLIPRFKDLYDDILEGKALPPLASFVMGNHQLILAAGTLTPVIMIAALFDRNL